MHTVLCAKSDPQGKVQIPSQSQQHSGQQVSKAAITDVPIGQDQNPACADTEERIESEPREEAVVPVLLIGAASRKHPMSDDDAMFMKYCKLITPPPRRS
jgi:hypothetical protein